MTMPVDPVVEADLQGYLDGHLPLKRRITVEAHLAARPELAARVMQDLRLRDELVLALGEIPVAPRLATAQVARRLSRRLRWRKWSHTIRRTAAVGMFLAIGWFAHAEYGALGIGQVSASGLPPAYVEQAIARFDGAAPELRDSDTMTAYDAQRILTETAITLPVLPDDWRVDNVIIAPADHGPGVWLSIHAPDLGAVSLIALRPGVFDVVPVTVAQKGAFTVAHWQIGDVAYALVVPDSGQADARELDQAADRLIRTLY